MIKDLIKFGCDANILIFNYNSKKDVLSNRTLKLAQNLMKDQYNDTPICVYVSIGYRINKIRSFLRKIFCKFPIIITPVDIEGEYFANKAVLPSDRENVFIMLGKYGSVVLGCY